MRIAPVVFTASMILASLALTAAPAAAQDAAGNAKCFIVSNAFAKGAKDEKAKQAATEVRWFYLGRLTGSAAQIEAEIAKQAASLNAKASGAAMEECAKAVAQKAIEVQNIGLKLAKGGAK